MLVARLQSFPPSSSKNCHVRPASPGEASCVTHAANFCTAAHLEKFFGWEPGTLPIWEGEYPPSEPTIVVEVTYNPVGAGTYSYRFWREESDNN